MTEQSFSTSADVLVKLHCCLTQNTIKRDAPPKKSIEKAINWQKQDVDSFCSLKMGHSEQLSTVKPQKSHQRLNHCNSVWNRPQIRENAQFAEDSQSTIYRLQLSFPRHLKYGNRRAVFLLCFQWFTHGRPDSLCTRHCGLNVERVQQQCCVLPANSPGMAEMFTLGVLCYLQVQLRKFWSLILCNVFVFP